jgi:hypothetical protein
MRGSASTMISTVEAPIIDFELSQPVAVVTTEHDMAAEAPTSLPKT